MPRRRELTVDEYVSGVLDGDRTILGRAITLVESNAREHQELAQLVLKGLLPHTGGSIRVGITGVPGAGKSTFIEELGCLLTAQGRKVAVLAIDPSSLLTRGSILGDKTRMERLAREPGCFIRPSPAGGTLGGVARKSRETMLVCEAAGFDVVLIETVGVGQSEVAVRAMVDFFLLLMIPGAGDELQGIKRGVMELADGVLINKADGENEKRAQVARSDFERALHYLMPATAGWTATVRTCSALTGAGVGEAWEMVEEFRRVVTESGVFDERRERQTLDWLHALVAEHLETRFSEHPGVAAALPAIERAVAAGDLPATAAVDELLKIFESD
jgi:LAO/AO transport system kinase